MDKNFAAIFCSKMEFKRKSGLRKRLQEYYNDKYDTKKHVPGWQGAVKQGIDALFRELEERNKFALEEDMREGNGVK
jgi:hypothetical protein